VTVVVVGEKMVVALIWLRVVTDGDVIVAVTVVITVTVAVMACPEQVDGLELPLGERLLRKVLADDDEVGLLLWDEETAAVLALDELGLLLLLLTVDDADLLLLPVELALDV